MSTPTLHPNASWNPAFRPDSDKSLPPIVAIATAYPSRSSTYLHNVTPYTTSTILSAAAAADEDMKEVSLRELVDGRDLEAGVEAIRKLGMKERFRDCSRWSVYVLVLTLTLGMGTCYTLGS